MKPTLFMMKGLPASGKSTYTKQLRKDLMVNGAQCKIVNKDLLRLMLDDNQWSRENERFVLLTRDWIIKTSLSVGNYVIVDDTNLAPKHELQLRAMAFNLGADFEIRDFSGVPVDECIQRDKLRGETGGVSVGEKVIRGMYDQFLKKD